MADNKKISELPLVDSLGGNEEIPIALNGSNGKVRTSKIKEWIGSGEGALHDGDTLYQGFVLGAGGGFLDPEQGLKIKLVTDTEISFTVNDGLKIGSDLTLGTHSLKIGSDLTLGTDGLKIGSDLTKALTLNNKFILHLGTPTDDDGAANKWYVDNHAMVMATAASTFAEGRATTMVLPNKFNIVDGPVEGDMDFYCGTREELAEQEAEEQEQLVIEGSAEQTEQTEQAEATEEQTGEQAEPYTPEPMVEMYHLRFTTGEGEVSLTFPERIKLPDGQTFLPNRIYDVQVVNECAIVNSWSV